MTEHDSPALRRQRERQIERMPMHDAPYRREPTSLAVKLLIAGACAWALFAALGWL